MPIRSAPTAALPKSTTGLPAARADFMLLKRATPTAPPTATPRPVARMRRTNVRRVLAARKKSDVLKIVSIRSALGACASDIISSPVLLDLNFIDSLLLIVDFRLFFFGKRVRTARFVVLIDAFIVIVEICK